MTTSELVALVGNNSDVVSTEGQNVDKLAGEILSIDNLPQAVVDRVNTIKLAFGNVVSLARQLKDAADGLEA